MEDAAIRVFDAAEVTKLRRLQRLKSTDDHKLKRNKVLYAPHTLENPSCEHRPSQGGKEAQRVLVCCRRARYQPGFLG